MFVALGFTSRLLLGILIPVGISAGRAYIRNLEDRAKARRRRRRPAARHARKRGRR